MQCCLKIQIEHSGRTRYRGHLRQSHWNGKTFALLRVKGRSERRYKEGRSSKNTKTT